MICGLQISANHALGTLRSTCEVYWEPLGAFWEALVLFVAILGILGVAFGVILRSVRHLRDPPLFFSICLGTESLGIVRSVSPYVR